MSTPGDPTKLPSEANRRHLRRKTHARLQLIGVLLLLVSAFVFFSTFAFSEECRARWPEMVGILFGGGIAMICLFGAVWGRQNWARVVLVMAIVAVVVVFGLYLLSMMTNPADANGPGVQKLSFGIGCLLAAGTWLVFSKRISYLTTPAGSGGRA